jgi:hypothetical protein
MPLHLLEVDDKNFCLFTLKHRFMEDAFKERLDRSDDKNCVYTNLRLEYPGNRQEQSDRE